MSLEQHSAFFVGTYTDSPSQSNGVYRVALNQQSGELFVVDMVLETQNPSYLTTAKKVLYTVNELMLQDEPQLIYSHKFGKATVPLSGDAPCHLTIAPGGELLAISHYGSGNVEVFELDSLGRPKERMANLFVAGKGANPDRQQSPHAHQAQFIASHQQLAVVDLGSDRVHFFDCDPETGHVSAEPDHSVVVSPGSGPRHLAVNKDHTYGYLVCEMSETLVTLRNDSGDWYMADELPLFAHQESQQAAAAVKLSPCEKRLYVSCRAQNRIVVFDVSGDLPQSIHEFDCGGEWPRDFEITPAGDWLVVANERSNNLTSYRIDLESGELVASGHSCELDKPVCVVNG